jgi:hypothetical protein
MANQGWNAGSSRGDRISLPTYHLHQVELADRWRVSPRTLEGWRGRHFGPPYLKVGGRVVYRLQDVEAFEEQQLRGV